MPRRRDKLPGMSRPNSSPHDLSPHEALALLEWQIAMGADEAIGETACDRLSPAPAAAAAQAVAELAPADPLLNPPPLAGEGRVGVVPPSARETPAFAPAVSTATNPAAPTRVAPPSVL